VEETTELMRILRDYGLFRYKVYIVLLHDGGSCNHYGVSGYRIRLFPYWLRKLAHSLTDFTVGRDEHKDFKEEMERLRALRGKTRVRSGWPGGVKPEKIVTVRYDKD
jgi:hypothetical protein